MNTYEVKKFRLTACGFLYYPKDDITTISFQPAFFKVHGTLRILGDYKRRFK